MSVELPDQREPVIENRPDLFMNITWFEAMTELARLLNRNRSRIAELEQQNAAQQAQIDDLIFRVEALESP